MPGPTPRRAGPDASNLDFLKRVHAEVRRTARRLRFNHALTVSNRWAAPFIAVLGVGWWVAWGLSPSWGRAVSVAALPLVLVLFAVLFSQGPQEPIAARALDQSHGLPDWTTTSLELWRRHERGEDLDPYFELALERMRAANPVLEAERAAPPGPWPGPLLALVAVMGIASLGLLERSAQSAQLSRATGGEGETQGVTLDRADLDVLQDRARELNDEMKSQAGKAAAERLNHLARDMASPVDEAAAFRRLAEFEAGLDADAESTARLDRELGARGRALSSARLAREAGTALAAGSKSDAAAALRQLAERLADPKSRLTPAELNQLREALEKARKAGEEASANESQRSSEDARRQTLEETQRRLRQKKESGKLPPEDAAELERTERELKRLERNKQKREQTLSDLDRELAEAARALEQERKKDGSFRQQAAENLKKAADQVEQAAARKMSDEEKKALIERMKRMKEELRQRRERGGSAAAARREFERRARGEEPGEGQPGESRPGEPSSEPGGQVSIPVPVPGRTGMRAESGQSDAAPGSQGKEPGSAHDPRVRGEPMAPTAAKTADVTAVGQDTGQGQTASETIRTAARAGFSRAGYESLFRDYQTVAEEVMTKEAIPPGYRKDIERYFELIRPRSQKDQP